MLNQEPAAGMIFKRMGKENHPVIHTHPFIHPTHQQPQPNKQPSTNQTNKCWGNQAWEQNTAIVAEGGPHNRGPLMKEHLNFKRRKEIY